MHEGLSNFPLFPVIIIVGPTAVGKTKLSIQLAKEINAAIVSADSRQIYIGMDIGTAKPSIKERQGIKHYFIDYISPAENFSAGTYGNEARNVIEKLRGQGKNVIVVSGSGLYIQALLYGMVTFNKKDDQIRLNLKTRVELAGIEKLYQELKEVDPELASRLSKNDTQRILRGLEVFQISGEKLSQMQKKEEAPASFPYLQIGLNRDRQKLYGDINRRVEQMFEAGLINEVNGLLEAGYGDTNALNAVGYKEVVQLLKKETDEDKAIELIQRNSRRYAKRQLTWFRKDKSIRWFSLPDKEIVKKILEII